MGAATVKALRAKDIEVFVWNRSPEKAKAVAEQTGAKAFENLHEALQGADVAVTWLTDVAAELATIKQRKVIKALKSKLWISFTTSTPQEARDTAAWADGQGIGFIDGAALCTPVDVGKPSCVLLVSGDKSGIEQQAKLVLDSMGSATNLGVKAGAASAMDSAVLSFFYSAYFGYLNSMAILRSEGMAMDSALQPILQSMPVIEQVIKGTSVWGTNSLHEEEGKVFTSVSGARAGLNTFIKLCSENELQCGVFEAMKQYISSDTLNPAWGPSQIIRSVLAPKEPNQRKRDEF